jgi:hypothetical protein
MSVLSVNIATTQTQQLVGFLQDELAVPSEVIPSILQKCQNLNRLPVILWQSKLVTLAELDRVLHWVERQRTHSKEQRGLDWDRESYLFEKRTPSGKAES